MMSDDKKKSKIIKSFKVVVSCSTEPDGKKMYSGDNRWCQIVLHLVSVWFDSRVQEGPKGRPAAARGKAGAGLKPGA